jgi:hypothetical protein
MRRVKVQATITYTVEVPAHWPPAQIEFHRNQSGWCADNMLSELEDLTTDGDCLCQHTTFRVSDEDGSEPYLKE